MGVHEYGKVAGCHREDDILSVTASMPCVSVRRCDGYFLFMFSSFEGRVQRKCLRDGSLVFFQSAGGIGLSLAASALGSGRVQDSREEPIRVFQTASLRICRAHS